MADKLPLLLQRTPYNKQGGQLVRQAAVYRFRIDPFPTANVFKRGHRIRVDISSSNFPRFDVNPNTGEPLSANRRARKAENTVYVDARRPSHIVLPVVADAARASGGSR